VEIISFLFYKVNKEYQLKKYGFKEMKLEVRKEFLLLS